MVLVNHDNIPMSTKKDRTVALALRIRNDLDQGFLNGMSHGAVDKVIEDLRGLRLLLGRCPDINLAIRHLERIKRPRADKRAEAQQAKNVGVRIHVIARNIADFRS